MHNAAPRSTVVFVSRMLLIARRARSEKLSELVHLCYVMIIAERRKQAHASRVDTDTSCLRREVQSLVGLKYVISFMNDTRRKTCVYVMRFV
jgi:hypothetical protein